MKCVGRCRKIYISLGHSNNRNFSQILFKIEDKVESCSSLFAIENKRYRLVNTANMADRVFYNKNPKWPSNKNFWSRLIRRRFLLILIRWSQICPILVDRLNCFSLKLQKVNFFKKLNDLIYWHHIQRSSLL